MSRFQHVYWHLQVVGLERIAIVIPAEAMNQFQSALTTCQGQHASGVVSARAQPPHQQIPLSQPSQALKPQISLQPSQPLLTQSPMQQYSLTTPATAPAPPLAPPLSHPLAPPMQQFPLTSPVSGPIPPLANSRALPMAPTLARPVSLGHGLTQVKHPPPGCGVGLLDPLPPVMFQPMWILPGA